MSGDPLDLDAINHNHVTRDVKALGDCPACDRYRADARAMPPGEDRTAGEYLSWSVSHWRGRARIAEAEVRRLRAGVGALADEKPGATGRALRAILDPGTHEAPPPTS